jgi:ankyrin repeat protein
MTDNSMVEHAVQVSSVDFSNESSPRAILLHTKSSNNLLQQQQVNKEASQSSRSIDLLIREQKKNDQLISALNELDRCKQRIKQLEDENRRLAVKVQTRTKKLQEKEQLTSPNGNGNSQKTKETNQNQPQEHQPNGEDSDDSDEDDPHQLIEELENRRQDWQAYLLSFAEEDGYQHKDSDDTEEHHPSRERKNSRGELEITKKSRSLSTDDNDHDHETSQIEEFSDSHIYSPLKSPVDEGPMLSNNPTPRMGLNPLQKNNKNHNQGQKKNVRIVEPIENQVKLSEKRPEIDSEDSDADEEKTIDFADIYRKESTSSFEQDSRDLVDEEESLNMDLVYLNSESQEELLEKQDENNIKRYRAHRKMSENFAEVSPLRANNQPTNNNNNNNKFNNNDNIPPSISFTETTAFQNGSPQQPRRTSQTTDNNNNNNNNMISPIRASINSPQRTASLTMTIGDVNANLVTDEIYWENPDEAIFTLIENDQQSELIHLLRSFPRVVRSVNSEGLSALHFACARGSKPLVEILISFNFPLDSLDYQGKTPLHHCRTSEIVEYLCEEGADPNVVDSAGLTPLLVFLVAENLPCIKVLLHYGSDPNTAEPVQQRNALHHAALSANYEMMSLLVVESQVNLMMDQGDLEGNTPLLLACKNEKEAAEPWKMIMLLLDKNASVTISNERGITPLHYICANRMLAKLGRGEPIIDFLLELGADPNAQDCDGCTPIVITVAYREWNLCKTLLDAGGDLNIPCSMNSVFFQVGVTNNNQIAASKDVTDMKAMEIMNTHDCTASDLLPKNPRYMLFRYIKIMQTRIPGETRDRCMNCGNTFTASSSFSMFRISSGKHHCRHCHRVICQDCSPNELARARFPPFVQDVYPENNLRCCIVCYSILIEAKSTK